MLLLFLDFQQPEHRRDPCLKATQLSGKTEEGMRRYSAEFVAFAVALMLAGLPAATFAQDESKAQPGKVERAKEDIKSGARQAGREVKETAKTAGHEVKEGAKTAGHEVKEGAKEVGAGAKRGWHELKHGAAESWRSVKNFFSRLWNS